MTKEVKPVTIFVGSYEGRPIEIRACWVGKGEPSWYPVVHYQDTGAEVDTGHYVFREVLWKALVHEVEDVLPDCPDDIHTRGTTLPDGSFECSRCLEIFAADGGVHRCSMWVRDHPPRNMGEAERAEYLRDARERGPSLLLCVACGLRWENFLRREAEKEDAR